jgi:BirA family transcriptional regulator, biotin operon repressor / biotin---[acetyl-CoA-carboxylase] ligase
LADRAAGEGHWLVAERQSGGRGRHGRVWQSPPGNFYGSTVVSLRPGDPPATGLALVAGVALAVTMPDLTGLMLKWPNDLIVALPDGTTAKLAGILLEREGARVVAGFGVNLAVAPPLTERSTIALAELGHQLSLNDFAERLAASFAHWLMLWRGQGIGLVRQAWLAAAHPLGTRLTVAEHSGAFAGLSGEGALLLTLDDGTTRTIHAGEVFMI